MRANMKKALSLLLALLMVMSLISCGEKTPAPAEDQPSGEVKYKECFVIGDSDTLTSLDPMDNNSSYNRRIYGLTHNTLMSYDFTTGELSPEAAESYDVTEDGLTYTFHLREGVTFHNGDPCTAEDWAFSFNRAMESSTTSAVIKDLASVEAPDEKTLVMNLSNPNAEFTLFITLNCFVALSEKAIGADPEKGAMVGTGPFEFTEWSPDDYVLVTRNENYWGEMPKSQQIKYRKISEASARVIALQTGEIDLCMEVPAIEAAHISDAEGCSLIELPSSKQAYVGMNVSGSNPALMDMRVRQALQYATDADSIIIGMTEGYSIPSTGFVVPSVWGYNPNVTTYEYNVDKAKDLLAEAGYADGFDISLLYKSASFPGFFEMLQAQWAKAGINLTLDTDDSSMVSDRLREKNYDLYMSQYLISTLGGALSEFWYSTSPSSRTLLNDPVLDGMIDEATSTLDDNARKALYGEISEYLNETACFIPLYIETMLFGVRDNAECTGLFGNGRHDLVYCYSIEE